MVSIVSQIVVILMKIDICQLTTLSALKHKIDPSNNQLDILRGHSDGYLFVDKKRKVEKGTLAIYLNKLFRKDLHTFAAKLLAVFLDQTI